MQANEIRVGNWLNDPRQYDPKFFPKTDNGYFKATARDIQYADEFEPIKLTEEILLKCEFNKLKDDNWGDFIDMWVDKVDFIGVLMKDNVFIGKDSKTNIYYFLVTRTGNGEHMYFEAISAPMEYVHTLQNYYVAFTGEELEINL